MKTEFSPDQKSDYDQPVVCTLCGLTLPTESELTAHEARCTQPNSLKHFNCQECGKAFPRRARLQIHLRTHTGERPFACLYCQMTFKKNHHAKRHMRQVHKMDPPRLTRTRNREDLDVPAPLDPFNQYEQPYLAEDSFPPMPATTDEIDLNENTSFEGRKFCSICRVEFVSIGRDPAEEIRQHMRLVHQFHWNKIPPPTNRECLLPSVRNQIIEECFDQESDWRPPGVADPNELLSQYPTSEAEIPLCYFPVNSDFTNLDRSTCEYCTRVFTNSESLARHQAKCTTKTPEPSDTSASVICFLCNKTFPNVQLLNEHTVDHINGRVNNANALSTSSRDFGFSVTQGKAYPAELPDEMGRANSQYSSEMQLMDTPYIVPPEKLFTCWKCGRVFNRKDNCKIHIKKCIIESPPNQTPTGEQDYTREDCGREFQGRFYMYGHQEMPVREQKDCEPQLRTLDR